MSRPLLARKDTKAREAALNRAVAARDGHVCRFEVMHRLKVSVKRVSGGGFEVQEDYAWLECGRKGSGDTCHIYRRRECGDVWDNPVVALRGCRTCHDRYDGRTFDGSEVRVPPAREAECYALLVAETKVPPPRRRPEGSRL